MSKRTKTVLTLRLTLQVPEGSNSSEVMEYVRSAVKSHCGGLDPESPMFDLDRDLITVSLLKKETTYA